MKVLYFDCFSGISGDMTLGALIDAGADFFALKRELQKLNLETEYELNWRRVVRSGISAVKVDVLTKEKTQPPETEQGTNAGFAGISPAGEGHFHHHGDHSRNGDHSHGGHHGHHKHHGHPDHHSHDDHHNGRHVPHHGHDDHHDHDEHRGHAEQHGHDGYQAHRPVLFRSHGEEAHPSGAHSHHHHHHHHVHRHYRDIVRIIENSGLSRAAAAVALSIFEAIGRAEAKIHGIPLEKVHFHEVGAVDSIIDIVGTAVCLEMLNIEKVFASPVTVGGGVIRIDHGVYPVPAPATLEMLRGVPLKQTDMEAELTTPTGAGILSALAENFGPMPSMKVENIGYGAGTKDFPGRPNVLRVLVGELC